MAAGTEIQVRNIRLSAYLLLAVILAIAIVVVAVLNIMHTKREELANLAYDNHLASAEISLAIVNRIERTGSALISLELRERQPDTPVPAVSTAGPVLHPRDHVRALKLELRKLVGELRQRNEVYPNADTEALNAMLARVAPATQSALDAMLKEGEVSIRDFHVAVQNLLALARQLHGLHRQLYVQSLQDVRDYDRRTLGLTLSLTAGGLFLIIPMLLAFSGRLRHSTTALHEAQAALEEREKNFASLARNMRGGVVVVRNRHICFVNRELAEMLGEEDPEALQGRDLAAIISPASMERVEEALAAAEDTDGVEGIEIDLRESCGARLSVEMACSSTTWQSQPAVLLVLRNLSELRQALHRLRETSQLLDNILENVPAMIFTKRASDLSFVFINRTGEELLGKKRDALLGRNDFDFFPPEQARFFTERDRATLEGTGVVDIAEEPIDTPRGRRILHTRKIAIRNAQGEAEYLLGISEDITDAVQRRGELARFKHALDQTLDCVFMFDPDSLWFIYANEGAARHLGYTIDEILRMHPYDIKPEFDEAAFRELIEPLRRDAEMMMNFETVHRHRDGHDIDVEIMLQCTQIGDHDRRYVAIVRDISERKQIERELAQHRERLEELVEERTAELVAARDEAERANAAKSEFLSRMSHELRTPMNAILGFGQILQLDSEQLSELQRRNVQEILDAGRHLLDLINEVLDLARIESGRREINVETLHVRELVDQCLPMIATQAEERGIRVIDRLGQDTHPVMADEKGLKQALLNLLSNAVKYNREDGSVAVDGEVLDDGYLRISVSDDGPGLTPEQMEKLYVPFERLDNGRDVEGTGIGLVITKHVVELMGGRTGVSSTPGHGSTFWIDLPLVTEARLNQC